MSREPLFLQPRDYYLSQNPNYGIKKVLASVTISVREFLPVHKYLYMYKISATDSFLL